MAGVPRQGERFREAEGRCSATQRSAKVTAINRREKTMRSWIAATLAALVFTVPLTAQAQKPETTKVRLAVGGKSSLYYLPLTLTERLGYFREAGLDVEISDFPGGAKSLQALIGGSADVVTGSYDHIIQMRAQNQPIVGLLEIGQFPGFALGIVTAKA